jgi:tetratricopeptide (TPR) repeat protein
MLAYGSFSGCIHIWPEFAFGYYNRAGVLRQLGKSQQALDDYTASLARDPKLADAYLNRGLTYLAEQRRAEALADFDRAAEFGRDQARVHWGRGIALEGLGRAAEADSAFARARSLDVENSEVLLAYGFAVSNRLPVQAEEAFNKVVRSEPRNARALYGYAMLAQRKSRNSEVALLYFNLALQADPLLVPARSARANVLVHRGECELARQDIDWCVKEDSSGVTLYAAACVYALIADRLSGAAADAFAERALELLKEAFVRGYGKEKAAGDSDLAHLHHNPEFGRLLQQHRETPGAQRGG